MSSNYLNVLLLLVSSCAAKNEEAYEQIINKVLKQCSSNSNVPSCLADRVASVVEYYATVDIPIFSGLTLSKIKEPEEVPRTRSLQDGFSRLANAMDVFVDTHSITLGFELSGEDGRQARQKGGKKGTGGMRYIMLALFGMYGIVGSFVTKAAALMAGKALVVSKLALVIASVVGLKKLIESGDRHSSVKVYAHSAYDEHDRNIDENSHKFFRTV
ncbi:uncharacterized protein LOC116180764 [Photinus pyralis]|uniref:uncharacterized protein LOC116170764 n=1 Tax=Photinus pyralis TaxID=7054 RepID=UPI0012677F84|nr:uncharacterized protein LOC116170764 [Photinus pyralis]XP_031356748.1 uncharacterized protein LOC116180764 [Photinus pyralis]